MRLNWKQKVSKAELLFELVSGGLKVESATFGI